MPSAAILACPACEEMVSAAAQACPHCGQPIAGVGPLPDKKPRLAVLGLVGIASVAVVIWISESDRRSDGRPGARRGETWFSEDGTVGCIEKADLLRVGELARQNDKEASLKLLLDRMSQGRCKFIKGGIPLYVEESSHSGFPCMRPQGDPTCLIVAERDFKKLSD